ncbi:AIPR family protein [Duganella dendranthematis]|uniref:AIPR family protein n=1 Tax=Duganella dendranthematis TaxID=2728021 RepID=A0ABX6MJ38_9BURK|nr:AIPR family protein [Duganella dendranthematis]
MHIILKNHVASMAAEYEYSGIAESKLFEFFCNYCVFSRHFLGRFDPQSVTTLEDDASIDGIAIIVDGDLIATVEEADAVFATHKTNLLVDIVITQVKSGEQFKKEEIANFKLGLDEFFSLDPSLPMGDFNKSQIAIMQIIFSNLKKVRNRQPNAYIYYCTSGTYKAEKEIRGVFEAIKKSVHATDYFHSTTVTPVGRTELLKYFAELSEKNEAKLQLIDYFGMPKMPGIPQSYVGIVNAKEFVSQLISDEDGNLKQSVFEENVRSFLGLDNEVNSEIQRTLESAEKRKLFSVLNNGITIVAPSLTLAANTKVIDLTNYQIINGCQTSSTLHANIVNLTEDVNVVIKFIESTTDDSAVDIISATNSQSDISKEAFFGLKNKAKHVRRFFDAQNGMVSPENFIHFERRLSEFRGAQIQATRIFDVREVARCYAAMFLNQPHNSARYVHTIFAASGDSLFKEDDHEGYYYAACLALYKYQTLINGRKNNAHNYLKMRWHIIQLFKWFVHEKMDVPLAGANKATAYATRLVEVLNSEDKLYVAVFAKCQEAIDKIGMPTDDALKRAKFTADLTAAAAQLV